LESGARARRVHAAREIAARIFAFPGELRDAFFRGDLWIVLLGRNLKEGIVGIGPTVSAELRAFDGQYLARLRPPNEALK
jgi:hypothetical protein